MKSVYERLLDAIQSVDVLEKENKALREENRLLRESKVQEPKALFRPMGYDEFKRLRDKEQYTYILRLRRVYNVTISDLARMMGVGQATLKMYVSRKGIPISGRLKTDKKAWEAFLSTAEVIR